MDYAVDFINKLSGNITGGINTCIVAMIESFDPVKNKADVKPLVRDINKKGEEEELGLLVEVPIATIKAGDFIIRAPFEKGDIVVVVFADSDIENVLLSGDLSNPNSTRKHSLDDAIIVGSILPYTDGLSQEHGEDLIIANKDFSSKIVLKNDGDIDIETSGDINLKANNINLN